MRLRAKLRPMHLTMLLAGFVLLTSGTIWAQANGADTAPKAATPSLISVVIKNMDFVFWLIMACSVVAVTAMVQGFIRIRRTVIMPEDSVNHVRELIGARQFKELIEFTETDPCFVSKSLNPALKRAPSFSSMKEAMETAVAEQTAEQFRKIEILNILGNLGPLLGLLGTVVGMIDAFLAMQSGGGSANPGELAGGISKALAHTMLGLMLAIPCLATFGILRTMADRLTTQAAMATEELLLMIKPAEAKPAAVAVMRPGAAPHPAGHPQPQLHKPVVVAPTVKPAIAPSQA